MKLNSSKISKLLVSCANAIMLLLSLGCPTSKGCLGKTVRAEQVTVQTVFDEAAKGLAADIVTLRNYYATAVINRTKADELADLHDVDNDYFVCKLLKLPSNQETSTILSDFLGRVTDAAHVLGRDCSSKSKPLELLIATSRTGIDDIPQKVDEMIKTIVEKGNANSLLCADNQPKIERVLDAVNRNGRESHLTKVMLDAPAGVMPHVLQWLIEHRADKKVTSALQASRVITSAKIFEELVASTVDTAKLRLYYDAAIHDRATADELANFSNGEFSVRLAALPANEDTLAIWTKHLGLVSDANGELLRDDNRGIVAIDMMVDNHRAVNDTHRNAVIAVMANYASDDNIAGIDTQNLTNIYDAVLENNDRALLARMFIASNDLDKHVTISWAYAHLYEQRDGIVFEAFGDAARANKFDHHDVMAAFDIEIGAVNFLYDTVIDTTEKADALANLDALEKFSARLTRFPQTQITSSLWGKHLALVSDPQAELENMFAGKTAFANMVESLGHVDAEELFATAEIVHKMIQKDNGRNIAAITDVQQASNLINVVYFESRMRRDLDKICQNLDDSVISACVAWAISFANETLIHFPRREYEAIRIQDVFLDEYRRRSGTARRAMRHALIREFYFRGMRKEIHEARRYLDPMDLTFRSTLVSTINAAFPNEAARAIDAIHHRMSDRGEEPIVALGNAGLFAGVENVVRRALVRSGVQSIASGIRGGFFSDTDLRRLNFDPFGTGGNATFLYAVLAQAKSDLGNLLLNHAVINDNGSGNGLASTLKGVIARLIDWHDYLDDRINLPAHVAITRDLVGPDAPEAAALRTWLVY